jgi:hypothetical protein
VIKLYFQCGRSKAVHLGWLILLILAFPLILSAAPEAAKVHSRSSAIAFLNGFDPFVFDARPDDYALQLSLAQSRSAVNPLALAGFAFPMTKPFSLCGAMGYQRSDDELLHYYMLGAVIEPQQSDSAFANYRFAFQKRYADSPLLRMRRFSVAAEIYRQLFGFLFAAGLELNLEKGMVNGYYPNDFFGMPYLRWNWRQSAFHIKGNGHLWSVSFSKGISL